MMTDQGRIAGMSSEDVKLTAEEGTVAIVGERKFEKEEKGERHHRVERAHWRIIECNRVKCNRKCNWGHIFAFYNWRTEC